MPFSAQDILRQLDACAERFEFPMLDNGYVYLAETRLHAYRDADRWALIIEVLGANNRTEGHEGIDNCLHLFGNCLTVEPGTTNDGFIHPTADGPEGATFEARGVVRREAKTIRIRGDVVEIPSREVLKNANGEVIWRGRKLEAHQLLRAISADHRNRLLATEAELRQFLPGDLPKILTLEEWFHPDLCENELPSENETFQLLAGMLETGNAGDFSPTREPNTHWKHWPQGGSL